MLQGDGKKGVEHTEAAIRYLEDAQLVSMLGGAWANLGFGYVLLGEMDTALIHMKKGLETDLALADSLMVCSHYRNLAMTYCSLGDLENARSYGERALDLARKHHYTYLEAQALLALGRTMGKTDETRSAEAEQYILQAMRSLDESKAKAWYAQAILSLGEFYVDTGQKQKALDTLKTTQRMMQEMGMTGYWSARTQKALEKLKAQ